MTTHANPRPRPWYADGELAGLARRRYARRHESPMRWAEWANVRDEVRAELAGGAVYAADVAGMVREDESVVSKSVRPILKYPGAKWALAAWVTRYLPKTPHYVEPFCGSAAVYFNLPWRPRYAVLNDLNGDIVNLFRVMREHGAQLAALIEMTPWSREEYQRSYEACEEPLERARRFLVRMWQGHGSGGLASQSSWRHRGVVAENMPHTWELWAQLPERMAATVQALREAEIENRPAVEVIRRSSSPNVLIYADPPYPFSTRYKKRMYSVEMTDGDHMALLDALDAHPGPVALSGYACALYDDRLAHWRCVTTQAQAEKGNTRTEALWLNPVLCERLSYGPLFEWTQEAA